MGGSEIPVESAHGGVPVDSVQQPLEAPIGGLGGDREVVGDLHCAAVDVTDPAGQSDAAVHEGRQVDVVSVGTADDLQ